MSVDRIDRLSRFAHFRGGARSLEIIRSVLAFGKSVGPRLHLISLRGGARSRAIIRSIPALGRSVGPRLHLISLGFIVIWTVLVFFGVGFSFLSPPPRQQISGSGGDTGTPRTTDVPAEARQAEPQEKGQGKIANQPEANPAVASLSGAEPKPGGNQAEVDIRDRKERGIETTQPFPVPIAGPRPKAQAVHSVPAREPHQRRASGSGAERSQTPLRANRDLLHRHYSSAREDLRLQPRMPGREPAVSNASRSGSRDR
jgi:hypothetical protein